MTDARLKVIFAGTPRFAALHAGAIIDSKHQLLSIYTQPDRRAGRGRQLQTSPVKQIAEGAGIPIYQPDTLKDAEVQAALAAQDADVLVVVAYGLILPRDVLTIPRFGCLNVHASLLPRWRGAAPIQRAIEAGDETSGITIMQMDAGLDTGDMLATAACPIEPRASTTDLHDQLALLGPELLLSVLDNLEACRASAQPQDDTQANYAHKLHKQEAEINWCRDATALDRQIRAFNPAPVCYAVLDCKRVRIWAARPAPAELGDSAPGTIVKADQEGIAVRCAKGDLVLQILQLEGGRQLPVAELLRAHHDRFSVGKRFELAATATQE